MRGLPRAKPRETNSCGADRREATPLSKWHCDRPLSPASAWAKGRERPRRRCDRIERARRRGAKRGHGKNSTHNAEAEETGGDEARQAKILAWWRRCGRRFPWRETRDPYRILLAEVLLQRTAAEQVVPVYEKLTRDYPAPFDLAHADAASLAGYFRSTGPARPGEDSPGDRPAHRGPLARPGPQEQAETDGRPRHRRVHGKCRAVPSLGRSTTHGRLAGGAPYKALSWSAGDACAQA